MTIGELARLFNDRFGIGAGSRSRHDEGWSGTTRSRRDRALVAQHPTFYTAIVYPGTSCSRGVSLCKAAAPPDPSSFSDHQGRRRSPFADWSNALKLPGVLRSRRLRAKRSHKGCPDDAAVGARFTRRPTAVQLVLTGWRWCSRPRGGTGMICVARSSVRYVYVKLPVPPYGGLAAAAAGNIFEQERPIHAKSAVAEAASPYLTLGLIVLREQIDQRRARARRGWTRSACLCAWAAYICS